MPEMKQAQPSRFYMNSQIVEFQEWGYIQCSNPEYLIAYEAELQQRKIDYRVVRGLGEYGLTIVICKPEKFQQYMETLKQEIERTEKILATKKDALQSLDTKY